MKLHYRELGSEGPALVILHGLYGSSDNWVSIARLIQNDFRIFIVDQRNHGLSPHSHEMNYESMANDLLELFNDNKLKKAHVIGHSMGGKTAMRFALENPERIDKLVILDIAPKSYASFSNYAQITNDHAHIINSLLTVDCDKAKSRGDLDKQLINQLPNKTLRQFLLKNITRTKDGKYQWLINLNTLKDSLETLMDGFSEIAPEENNTSLPTVFIIGDKSGYVMEEDTLIIRKYFKEAEIVTIPNAGHWLHAEQPELLIKTLKYFLLD